MDGMESLLNLLKEQNDLIKKNNELLKGLDLELCVNLLDDIRQESVESKERICDLNEMVKNFFNLAEKRIGD